MNVTRLEYKALNSALHSIGASTLAGERDRINVCAIVTSALRDVGRHSATRSAESYLLLSVWARDAWTEQAA